MDYYIIKTDYDSNGNSPWDSVWPVDKDDELLDIECLNGSLTLQPIWKSPRTKLEKSKGRPDIFGFVQHFAVTSRLRDLLAPIVGDEAEFLPVEVPNIGVLYVVHPLWPIDLNEQAEVEKASAGYFNRVMKYSFKIDPDQWRCPQHLFRIRQGKGSRLRDNGYTMPTLIVSADVKFACEQAAAKGIAFKFACSA